MVLIETPKETGYIDYFVIKHPEASFPQLVQWIAAQIEVWQKESSGDIMNSELVEVELAECEECRRSLAGLPATTKLREFKCHPENMKKS